MPFAILGTGRSGTSMVARMLNLSGLYLGKEKDLWDPRLNPDMNPTGYWEHQEVHAFMDRLFARLEGTWENPPLLAPGWEYDAALRPFYQEAKDLMARLFGGCDNWGWKLPKATVAIAFWQRVIPDLKFIICVRNPLDFASSMETQTRNSRAHLFAMWQHYNYHILAATNPESRFVTFYEDYFPCCQPALEPLLAFAGLPPQGIANPCLAEFHSSRLKHHSSTVGDVLADQEVPYVARQLYLELLSADPSAGDLPLLRYQEMLLPLLERALIGEGMLDKTAAVNVLEYERLKQELKALRIQRRWTTRLGQIPAAVWKRFVASHLPKTSKFPKPAQTS